MTDPEEAARLQLRERQGAGARYDSPAAPARDLQWARRGTAYFARRLNELSDGELDAPSRLPGWSRRHLVAHVGYHARGLARLVEAARNGAAEETLAEPEAKVEDVAFGATLPAHALRHLFKHSEVHLSVEWRDLTEAGWRASVRSVRGEIMPIATTPWLRAREIWMRALDLDNGGSPADFPSDLRQALRHEGLLR
jgi:maleylpyruvate isomerase